MRQLIIGLGILLCSLSVAAEWVEASGQAVIRGGDEADARARATEDAVRRALLYAGASIRSVQQVTNGLLTESSIQLQSQAEVRQVQLVREQRIGRTLEVTIRADIFPQQSRCAGAAYKKPVLVTPFMLRHPQQSVIGDLQNIGDVSARKVHQQLQSLANSALPTWTELHDLHRPLSARERSSLLLQTQADYLVSASIEDVSLGERTDMNLRFWSDARRERFFHLHLQLKQLSTGKVLFQQEYRTQARWDYRKRTSMSPLDHRFWQSSYGEAVSRVLDAAVIDIEEALRCEPFHASISEVGHNRIQLSTGQNVGLQQGDELTILYRQQAVHHDSTRFRVSPLTVRITEIGYDWAVAESINERLLSNVQVGDAVTKLAE
ncbi:flagellar assembly protein T N-terminal domain-containing protein [Alkalimonas delamerensis]|uniref:Flagellar assembly protein T N-terminal domain-containing protein n=1 Tax=Alkalimonas delamerensis TaxID=265981 RepID=A0ABT9GMW4_9GAMM|nr:flagellar assembly protein T N-terminal domain-containing protein [Alkalimonas delamerensis]MDP4528301.1 flagellar assembly protein T N-terminal domain-containing protein [Alkalimonas delamerensis]